MHFTDIFIKRPVLATVVSLMILLMGLYSLFGLPLREYPEVSSTMITVNTTYSGASASVIQGFISQPLTQAIAQSEGIDYMTSSSTMGNSTISLYMNLNYDPNAALAEVMAKVNSVKNQLPDSAQDPVVTKSASDQFDLMYLSYNSANMTAQQTTDYVSRVVQPQLQAIDGVSQAELLGANTFSMRIWLDPQEMVAHNLSATDITNALTQNNFQSAAGQTKGELVLFNINADTDLHDADTFANMVVLNDNGALVRLQDVAKIELGSQTYDSNVSFNGKNAIFVGISTTPEANPLTVSESVHQALPDIEANYPEGLDSTIVYDGSIYISSSTHEVIETIAITAIIVILVIFAFLGSIRTVIIPVVTMPLSMIGVCFIMQALGYSLNLLTLLAMVLAIGLVVDDAIVVVENIYRHIEEGKSSKEAALLGAREICSPIITMTITLAAVYAPIGFMGGLTGELFTEFAFTLAGAVILSGIIALTLSPMMCSIVLSQSVMKERLVIVVDNFFEKIKNIYEDKLTGTLKYRPVTVVFSIIILVSCYFLAVTSKTELAPQEDQSSLWVMYTAPQYANIDYMDKFSAPINGIFKNIPQMQDYFLINGMGNVNSGIAGLMLKPWENRDKSQAAIKAELQPKLAELAGLRAVVFELPSLPGNNSGLPVQFVITTTKDFSTLYQLQDRLKRDAQKSGLFAYIDDTLDYNNPELDITIDRDKAADMGINMQQLGNDLSNFLSGGYINWFSMEDRSYQVIPQIKRSYRANPEDLEQYYIETQSGDMIPLTNIANITTSTQPNALSTFQQLNSATVQGVMVPGHTTSEGLDFLRKDAQSFFPKGVTFNYSGESRQQMQEGSSLLTTFFLAIIVIYLVLAAKFESWRDPMIILFCVPMSICGALIPINIGMSTLNIYSGIGLITLVGLITKHGILIVEFANQIQRDENLSAHDAVIKSASWRLRPVLMTTFSMVFGVMPLLFAAGAGAKSRFDIGLVIFTGMLIGTLFTLFVVPVVYTFLAKNHRK